VAAVIAVAGGPVALAVPLLAWLARGRRAWLPWIALTAMAASGLLSAARPFGTGLLGPFGWPAQACALVALTAALIPVTAALVTPTSGTPNPGTPTSGTLAAAEPDG
jgi:arabinofuranan 3-O-arabinosyltransferase